ncbi:Axin-2 [Ataeniobius toweri]|uniref:Axin-2 n=1 Tax=Ataeniobius toweri TaxID=208326 RepID=A0ABU7BHR3_9TELE|nr:Axin-2 [Ataeniobius toweri]
MSRPLMDHSASSFREDAPRPPVPGEEGDAPRYPSKAAMIKPLKSAQLSSPGSSTRRNEDGLGEPEGSASPDSPLSRWTKSLHSLLGDQDGALLFRTFLQRDKSVDALDFWFACNGFRQMDLKDAKTQRVAKAIYKRYIENNSVVAKQLKPATKTFIRDNIKKQHIDSAMFDQAQTEIQTNMEENAYQMFLTSDIYHEYVRTGGENPGHVSPGSLGSLKVVCGYLPTLNEEEEWSCDFKAKALVGLKGQRVPITRAVEMMEKGYRYVCSTFYILVSRSDAKLSWVLVSVCRGTTQFFLLLSLHKTLWPFFTLSQSLQQQPSAGARLDFRSFKMVPQSEGSSSREKFTEQGLALAPASK